MEDGPKKDGFLLVIGGYMKMAYKTWNREHFVSDEIIKGDLHKMSDGKLIIANNISLDGLSNSNRRKRKDDNDRGGRNDRRNDRGGRNDRRNDRGGRNDRRNDRRGRR